MESGELLQRSYYSCCFLLEGTIVSLCKRIFAARIRYRALLSQVVELKNHGTSTELRAVTADVNWFRVVYVEKQRCIKRCRLNNTSVAALISLKAV
jgi:hypothetical protein